MNPFGLFRVIVGFVVMGSFSIQVFARPAKPGSEESLHYWRHLCEGHSQKETETQLECPSLKIKVRFDPKTLKVIEVQS